MPAKKPKSADVAPAPEKADGYGLSSKGEGKAPQIRHERPEVAKHCARMILAHNMDSRAAVSKMLEAEYPGATEAQIESLARTIQASPYVQREMTTMLEEIGIDDSALKKLIGLLWQEAFGGNDKRWPAAVRLLAEITGAAKARDKNPKLPSLRLAGMEGGLKEMLGGVAPTDDSDADGGDEADTDGNMEDGE